MKATNDDEQVLSVSRMQGTLDKVLAIAIPLALIAGSFCAISSLSASPDGNKFVYNNSANVLGLVAVALVFALSAVQKNVYWYARKRKVKLDERQVVERQGVFETSYKIGALLVLVSACWLASNKANLPAILNNPTNFNVIPGAIFWPFFNLAITLFALPLIVATFSRRH